MALGKVVLICTAGADSEETSLMYFDWWESRKGIPFSSHLNTVYVEFLLLSSLLEKIYVTPFLSLF